MVLGGIIPSGEQTEFIKNDLATRDRLALGRQRRLLIPLDLRLVAQNRVQH
jgi:hypothetical protein